MNKNKKLLITSAMIGMGSAFGLSQSEILANTETPETQEGDSSILSTDVIENDSSIPQEEADPVTTTEQDTNSEEHSSASENQSNGEESEITDLTSGEDPKEEIKTEQEENQEEGTIEQIQPSTLLNGMVANKYYESGTMMTDQMISIGNQDYYADGTGELHPLQAVSYTMTRNNVQETLKGYIIPNGQVINVNSVNADFFIVQATNGYKGENKQFSAMADAVLANNKLLAMMHEARTGTKEDGHMEALHFYQTIKGYAGKGIPILKFMNTDLEAGPVWADEFMDTLYGLSGMKGMIWTSEEVMNKGDWEQAKKEQEVVTNITSLTMTKEEWKKKSETSLPSKVEEMYRMYNPYSGEHLYTKNGKERDELVKIGWRYESIGWSAPEQGGEVYRLYNPYSGDHLYTTKATERDGLVKLGWRYEGIGFHSDDKTKYTAVYRLFNPYTTIGTHHFTTNEAEYKELQKYGWRGEGIGWYGTLSTVPRNATPSNLYIKNDCIYNEYRMKRYGIYKVNGKLYYFDPLNNGKKQTKEGLTSVYNSNNKVYITSDGSLYTGAMKYQNKTYKWFDLNNGYMAKNTFVKIAAHLNDGIEARNYYDGNGDLLYGYYQLNGKEVMYGTQKEPLTSLDSLWIRKNNYLTFAEQQHNANLIWNYFVNKGWSKNAIAALLGNMQAESNINPGLWESLDENNLNCGYGLVQWTPASKIIEWLYANGFEKDSGFGQCERILYELQQNLQYYATSTYPLSFDEFIVSTESPEYLANVFLVNYERPANQNQPKRQEYARYWYDYFTA